MQDFKSKFTEKIREIINSNNKNKILGLAFVVALALIAFSNCSSNDAKEVSQTKESFDYQLYATQLEERVERIVESIEGAGKCSVMITLEKTEEYVFFTEEKISTNTEEETAQDKTKQTIESDKETKAGVVENKNSGSLPNGNDPYNIIYSARLLSLFL